MNPSTLLALATTIVVLAGCVSPDAAENDARTEPTGTSPDAVASADAPRGDGTGDPLADRPALEVGDWWKVRVTSSYFSLDLTATIVVAEARPDAYVIGVPALQDDGDGRSEADADKSPYGDNIAYDQLLEVHIPPLGPVQRSTLAFESHEHVFAPVRFPLSASASWSSNWWGTPTTLSVTSIDGPRATINVANEWDPNYATLVYDADIGFLSSFDIPGYAKFEVLDHGKGFAGVVIAPEAYDVLFDVGRWRGVFWGPSPQTPDEAVVVSSTFNRLSVGVVLESATAPGFYEARFKPPRGEERVFQLLPSEGMGPKVSFFGQLEPQGRWQMRLVAGGDGATVIEGIASSMREYTLVSD